MVRAAGAARTCERLRGSNARKARCPPRTIKSEPVFSALGKSSRWRLANDFQQCASRRRRPRVGSFRWTRRRGRLCLRPSRRIPKNSRPLVRAIRSLLAGDRASMHIYRAMLRDTSSGENSAAARSGIYRRNCDANSSRVRNPFAPRTDRRHR